MGTVVPEWSACPTRHRHYPMSSPLDRLRKASGLPGLPDLVPDLPKWDIRRN
jgi:hypothetical protein